MNPTTTFNHHRRRTRIRTQEDNRLTTTLPKATIPSQEDRLSSQHNKVWYAYNDFENADIAKQQFHQQYPGKPSLNQGSRARKWRDLGLNITNTATHTTTTAFKNDDTKTTDTQDCARRIGNHLGATSEPPILSPTQVGRSSKERISSPGARTAVVDSMLR